MKKQIYFVTISLFLSLNSVAICPSEAIYPDSINDGPYIFKTGNKFEVKWINNSLLSEEYITPENYVEIRNKFNLLFSYSDLTNSFNIKLNFDQNYNMVDSIGVISDIHGKYFSYLNLLKSTGIIDDNLNWKFGKGHLVVLGDIFDRGEMVTEVLWHLFGLEKQAAEAGGMVHVLLGNHELMVLSEQLNYINEKYTGVERIANIKYFDLYSKKSVLGKWLRSRPILITINNIIFVHAGISIELVHRNLSVNKINQIFYYNIVGKVMNPNIQTEEQLFLIQDNGPVWYRGYFADKNFRESRLDSILDFYQKKYIVVGHTTSKDIKSFYHNKILGIDAGIMIDQPGSMLIYKNGLFYKGTITGDRIKL